MGFLCSDLNAECSRIMEGLHGIQNRDMDWKNGPDDYRRVVGSSRIWRSDVMIPEYTLIGLRTIVRQ